MQGAAAASCRLWEQFQAGERSGPQQQHRRSVFPEGYLKGMLRWMHANREALCYC